MHRHTLYSLSKNAPKSSTSWIFEDAEQLPQKLFNMLSVRFPLILGSRSLGEVYSLKSVQWASDPIYSSTKTTRSLEISLGKVKSFGLGPKQPESFTLLIPDVPFPYPHKSTYTISGHEYTFPSILSQKPGCFFVNVDETTDTPNDRNFLVQGQFSTSLVGENVARFQVKNPDQTPFNINPLTFPVYSSELGEFLNLIETVRRDPFHSSTIFSNCSNSLKSIFRSSFELPPQTNVDRHIQYFVATICSEPRANSSWKVPFERLSKSIDSRVASTTSHIIGNPVLTNSLLSHNLALLPRLDDQEFLQPVHMDRHAVSTFSDQISKYLSSNFHKIIDESISHYKQGRNHSNVLVFPFSRRNWTTMFPRLLNRSTVSKIISEAYTVEQANVRASLIKQRFSLFDTNITPGDPESSHTPTMVDRSTHHSHWGYIFTHNESVRNVGIDRLMSSICRRDPSTGELLKPVKNAKTGETSWLSSQHYTDLEHRLKERSTGVSSDKPQQHETSQLRVFGELIDVVPSSDVEYHLDINSYRDIMPTIFASSAHINQTDLARLPMALAGKTGSVIVQGSTLSVTDFDDPEIESHSKLLTNTLEWIHSPVSGKVVDVNNDGYDYTITLVDESNQSHEIVFPTDKFNPHKTVTGSCPYVQPGDTITEGQRIGGPSHPVYKRQSFENDLIASGVGLTSISISIGQEDEVYVSTPLKLSGRVDELSNISVRTEHPGHQVILNKFQPGTVIEPNTILAYQVVDGNPIPIRSTNKYPGFLVRTRYENDPNSPISNVTVDTNKTEEIDPQQWTKSLIQTKLSKFVDYYNRIGLDYLPKLKDKGLDISESIDTISITLENNGKSHDLSFNIKDYKDYVDMITVAISDPNWQIKLDPKFSYPNETIFYLNETIQRLISLEQDKTDTLEIPTHCTQLFWDIETLVPALNGLKTNNESGAKGISRIFDYMPPVFVDGKFKPAEYSYTNLAIIARGAVSKYQTPTTHQESFLYDTQGNLSPIDVKVSQEFEWIQKSNTHRGNVDIGDASTTKDGYSRITDGAKISVEGNILLGAASHLVEFSRLDPQDKQMNELLNQELTVQL